MHKNKESKKETVSEGIGQHTGRWSCPHENRGGKDSGKKHDSLQANVGVWHCATSTRGTSTGLRAGCRSRRLLLIGARCRGFRWSRIGGCRRSSICGPIAPHVFPFDAGIVETVCELLNWLVNSQGVDSTVIVIGGYSCGLRAFGKISVVLVAVGNSTCCIFHGEFVLWRCSTSGTGSRGRSGGGRHGLICLQKRENCQFEFEFFFEINNRNLEVDVDKSL